jgi:hypothetical protein
MIKQTFANIQNNKKTPFVGCKSPILRPGGFLNKNTPQGFLDQKCFFVYGRIFR